MLIAFPVSSFIVPVNFEPDPRRSSTILMVSSDLRACDPDELEKKKKAKEKQKEEKKKEARAAAKKRRAEFLKRLSPEKRARMERRDARRKAANEKKRKIREAAEKKRAEKSKKYRAKLHAKALEKMKSQVQFANSSERLSAIGGVAKLEEKERAFFIPHLIRFAEKDADPLVRKACLDTLAKLEIKKAEKVVIKGLEDDYPEVRRAAVSAVNHFKFKSSVPVLIRLIKKEDFKTNNVVLITMINSLGHLGEKKEIDFFRARAAEDDTHGEVRNAMVLYFGKVDAKEVTDYLHKIAADEDANILTRSYAINSLGRLKQPKSLEPLRKILKEIRSFKSKTERVRYNAMKLQLYAALIRLGDKSVHTRILAAAKNNDANVRVRAVKQLGNIRLKTARPMLCYQFKHDRSRAVRKAARAAIKKIDGTKK